MVMFTGYITSVLMVRSFVNKAFSCSKLNGLQFCEAFNESGRKDACRTLFCQSYVLKLDHTFVVKKRFFIQNMLMSFPLDNI